MSIVIESWAPNPDFAQNHVFTVREHLHRFRTKPTPDSDSSRSKVLPPIWILVFLSYVRHPLLICTEQFGFFKKRLGDRACIVLASYA